MKTYKIIGLASASLLVLIGTYFLFFHNAKGENLVFYTFEKCGGAMGSCKTIEECCEKGHSFKKKGDPDCHECKEEDLKGGNFVYFKNVGCSGTKQPCNSREDCCEKGLSYKKDGDPDCRGCKDEDPN